MIKSKVRELFKRYPILIKSLIFVGIIMAFYFLFKPFLVSRSGSLTILKNFIVFYQDSLLAITQLFTKNTQLYLKYFPDFDMIIWNGGSSVYGIPFLALRQSFIFFLIMIILHQNVKNTFLWLAGGFISFYLINLFRLFCVVLVPVDPSLTRSFFRALISIGIFLILLYKLRRHQRFSIHFINLVTFLQEKVILNIGTVIILFLSRSFLISLYKLIFPKEFLSKIILYETAFIIRLFGAEPRIDDRLIYIRRTWVYLGDACLGIMLILTYIALILMLRAKFPNKIYWIFGGILGITVINSVRIAAISFHLQNHGGTFSPKMDPHELFSYIVYAVVFILWVVFIRYGRGKS